MKHDHHAIVYPNIERRHYVDVFPGMTFVFHKHVGRLGDFDPAFNDKSVVWTVVAKTHEPGQYVQHYLLLGTGPIVVWHTGELGWIRRIVDPGCEARDEQWRAEARAAELACSLNDVAIALSA